MVVPAFGFSSGDFISLIALVGKALKALRDTDGASSRYQQAAVDLELLHSVLRKVQSLEPGIHNRDIVHKIQVCSHGCHIPLARFAAKIQPYEKHLGLRSFEAQIQSFSKWPGKGCHQVKWAMVLESELSKLKSSIGPALQLIGILIQLESLERAGESELINTKTHQLAQELLLSVNSLKDLVNQKTALAGVATDLEPILDKLSIERTKSDAGLFDLKRTLRTSLDGVEDKLSAQEARCQRIEHHLSTISGMMQYRSLFPPNDDGHITPCEPDSRAYGRSLRMRLANLSNGVEDCFILNFYQLIQAIRHGATQVFLILVCLVPALQRIIRTMSTIARSPTLLLQNNIQFEDALGRVMSLPYEHFRYWSVFRSRLEIAFKGLPGELKVRNNEFAIIMPFYNAELMLTRRNWDEAPIAGAKLTMSMEYLEKTGPNKQCPHCGAAGKAVTAHSWQCEQCVVMFRIIRMSEKFKNSLHSSLDPKEQSCPWTENPRSFGDTMGQFVPEMRSFKRLHFHSSRLQSSLFDQKEGILGEDGSEPRSSNQGPIPRVPIPRGPISRGPIPRYWCKVPGCNISCSRESDLQRHRDTVHGPEYGPFWRCTTCGHWEYEIREDKIREHCRLKHRSEAKDLHLYDKVQSLEEQDMVPKTSPNGTRRRKRMENRPHLTTNIESAHRTRVGS